MKEHEVPFQLYFGFHMSDLLKINTASSPRIRYKLCTFGWNRSVMKVNLLERTRYLYVHISGFNGEIFVKLHTSHFPRMRYTWCTFGCNRSMMKGLYWENKVRFLLYLGFHKIFPKLHTLYFPRMRYKRCKVSCDRAIMKDNLLAGLCHGFRSRNTAEIRPAHFPPMRYSVCTFSCSMTIIQGTLLGEQSVFSGVSRLS